VSIYFPATMELGMGGAKPTGDLAPKWAIVNNARESQLIKKMNVKAADGTEHTFDVAGHDTADAAKGIGKGADKTGKVTVYYTEEGGKKVAHFFEKL